eukprot:7257729-Prymnesium_polylepis.1
MVDAAQQRHVCPASSRANSLWRAECLQFTYHPRPLHHESSSSSHPRAGAYGGGGGERRMYYETVHRMLELGSKV